MFFTNEEQYFLKVSLIDSEPNKKPFLFFKRIFDGEFFLFGSPSDFRVFQSSFGLAIFSDSFSLRYCFLFCLIVLWTSLLASFYIFQSMLRRLDLKNYKLIFISVHTKCVHLQLRQVLLHLSKEQRFWKLRPISYIWYKNPSLCRVSLKKFSKIKSYITNTVQVEKLL